MKALFESFLTMKKTLMKPRGGWSFDETTRGRACLRLRPPSPRRSRSSLRFSLTALLLAVRRLGVLAALIPSSSRGARVCVWKSLNSKETRVYCEGEGCYKEGIDRFRYIILGVEATFIFVANSSADIPKYTPQCRHFGRKPPDSIYK